ncbi:MAG: hypothetical protein LC808_09345 [Actinobacteria bacterium]|nr:hypothetical protein [Actinomycetota bacterium]
MAESSRLTEARLDSLYNSDGFGGEKTMRARVIRELIDEIRTLRAQIDAGDHGPPVRSTSPMSDPRSVP